jgi:two-component system sensor kinase FixL
LIDRRKQALKYLRDWALFATCYISLDWASYIDAVGPFNITPWNPQPGLAVAWMVLAGLGHAPAVAATIALADALIRDAPGGYLITAATALVLSSGYAGIALALRRLWRDPGLRSVRDLSIFASVTLGGAALVGAVFIGMLAWTGALGATPFLPAWERFWIGDAVGILVTAPLLLVAADQKRRRALLASLRRTETQLQALVLAAVLAFVFLGLGGEPVRHFYLLFLPLIWISLRSGLNGAIIAIALVQLGVVAGMGGSREETPSILELQTLLAGFSLTGLFLGAMVEEHERAEEAFRQTVRLAAAGEMAGAIAHEVNQPLTALANYGRAAQMLLVGVPANPERAAQVIGQMIAEGERAAEIVRRLRDFFRMGTTRLEKVAAAELLDAACAAAGKLVGSRPIHVSKEVAPGLPALYVDRLQAELVMRNLLANAIDAIAATSGSGKVVLSAQREDDRHLRILVIDDGPGISQDLRESIFSPMTSAKPAGMGLGLAISRAIAEAHGGQLLAPPASHGEFHLILPCVSES